MRTTRIMLAGVGGQGTILAARIISEAALASGYDVKMAEIHGMSQRGGSVVSHVAFGDAVSSPVPGIGTVDILIAFEQLEGMRQLPYLKPGGRLISNTRKINPMPVLIGAAGYPEPDYGDVTPVMIDCATFGIPRVENVILIGALSALPEFTQFPWEATIRRLVKSAFLEINLAALSAGAELAMGSGKT